MRVPTATPPDKFVRQKFLPHARPAHLDYAAVELHSGKSKRIQRTNFPISKTRGQPPPTQTSPDETTQPAVFAARRNQLMQPAELAAEKQTHPLALVSR